MSAYQVPKGTLKQIKRYHRNNGAIRSSQRRLDAVRQRRRTETGENH